MKLLMTDGSGEEDYLPASINTMSQNTNCSVNQRAGSPKLSIEHDNNLNDYTSTKLWTNSYR